MKKILFTTTALVAGAMISSAAMADGMASKRYSSSMKSSSMSSANQLQSTRYLQQNDMMGASAFKATVGGYANWMVGYVDNDKKDTLNTNEFDVMGDAEVHFNFAAALKNGMKVGATAQLIADTTSEAGNIDQAYMYVSSMYGKVMVGRHDNVNEQLSLHAIDLGALDIQETTLTDWIIAPTGIPTEATATYFTADEALTKISYITPNFSGFQAGATFAPRGHAADDTVVYGAGELNATMLTAAYNATVDGVGFGVSAGYSASSGDADTKWNVGGRVVYQGFTVSAAYKTVDTGANDNLTVFDAGVAYEMGPYGVSLSYIAADQDKLDASTLMLSGVYNMAAGVDAFATIGMGDYENQATAKNDGFAVIGGMMLSF